MPTESLPKLSMYIGGEWVPPASGEYIETVDPFTAKPWALVPRGNAEDADRAVRCTMERATVPFVAQSAGDARSRQYARFEAGRVDVDNRAQADGTH